MAKLLGDSDSSRLEYIFYKNCINWLRGVNRRFAASSRLLKNQVRDEQQKEMNGEDSYCHAQKWPSNTSLENACRKLVRRYEDHRKQSS